MTLVGLLLTLVLFGVALYLIGLIPMDPTVKTIVRVVAIVAVLLYVLNAMGLLAALNIPIGTRRR